MFRAAWFYFLAALGLIGDKALAQYFADDLNGMTRVLDREADLTTFLSLVEVSDVLLTVEIHQ